MTASQLPAIVRPRPRPQATSSLICLSFCGGGTAPFRRWANTVPSDIELVLICYPGREARFTEPFAPDWAGLLDDVTTALKALSDRPYVLFGHSMGAQVAFDATVTMEKLRLRQPDKLILSAQDSSTTWDRRRFEPPTSDDTDEFLLDWMSNVGQLNDGLLSDPELCQIALEILRADIRVGETYHYLPGTQVRTPVNVIYGSEDADMNAEAAERWRPLTTGPFQVDQLPGGHFYTTELWDRLPEVLLKTPWTVRQAH